MKHTTVKMQDAMKLLNLNSRQSLHYYIKKGWLKADKVDGENFYNVKDVLKLKEYLNGPV